MDLKSSLLSLLIWLPIIGGGLTLFFSDKSATQAKWFALIVALVTLGLGVPLYFDFDQVTPGMQFLETHEWIPSFGIFYNLGADGISIALILLTLFTSVLVFIGAWNSIDKRVPQYFAAFLILEGLMVGVFCAMDAVLFYVFFEGMLIPMFIIIGVWGGPRRVYASIKFFLFTFLGSVFMLIGLVYLYLKSGSFQLADWYALPLECSEQMWLFFAFLAAFAVKVPMFPVHTWLPDAHVEAPTAVRSYLAAIMRSATATTAHPRGHALHRHAGAADPCTDYYSAGLCALCHRASPVLISSCPDCLAWGTRRVNSWRCDGCRGWRRNHPVQECICCRRNLPVAAHGACRLCYLQAVRTQGRPTAAMVLAANHTGQQLRLADLPVRRPARTLPHPDDPQPAAGSPPDAATAARPGRAERPYRRTVPSRSTQPAASTQSRIGNRSCSTSSPTWSPGNGPGSPTHPTLTWPDSWTSTSTTTPPHTAGGTT